MALRVNWCHTCGWGRNFGDQVTPRLLSHYGIDYEWAPPRQCDLIGAGSILSKIPRGWRGTVWGTGLIHPGMHSDLRSARILALRGELTAAHVKGPRPRRQFALGDPGILVGDLDRAVVEPSAVLLAPHYVDKDMVARHPGLPVLDITGPAETVLGAVASAGLLITSSLHALIAADALGVPHIVEPHHKVTGGLFKFTDYVSAFGESITPGKERLTDRSLMAQRQKQLRDALWLV